jgi:hypothetical protein
MPKKDSVLSTGDDFGKHPRYISNHREKDERGDSREEKENYESLDWLSVPISNRITAKKGSRITVPISQRQAREVRLSPKRKGSQRWIP